jgi:PAS domain S-box-containing protein
MTIELRILIFEDISEDAELIKRILKKENFSFSSKIVGRKKDFLRELKVFQPDLILSDYSMPQFTGLEALEIVRKITPETPFIIITGSLNEEKAVGCIKAGAWDYLIKDNLSRLGSAVKSAMILKDERDKRLRALETLRESEKIYRSFVENASDIIFITDIQGNYRFGNSAGLKTSGYALEELQKLSYIDLIVPEYKNRIRLHYMRQYRTREPESFIEYPFRSKDGKIMWFAQKSSLIYEDGAITGIHHLARDITERKQAEITLQNSETRYRTLFNASPTAISVIDLNGSIVDCNPATLKIHGLTSKEEVTGTNAFNLVAPCDRQRAIAVFNETIETGISERFEFLFLKKDGLVIPVEASAGVIRDSSGNPESIVVISQDITERKRAEEERVRLELMTEQRIRETQKMEAIGTLAGGFAHEFNNILAAIIGYAELSLDEVPEDSQVHSDLKQIFKAGNRARSLISQILTFSRQREQGKSPISLAPIVKETLKPPLEAERRLSSSKGREHILFVDDEQDIVNVGKRILENLGFTVTIFTSSLDALELFKKTPDQFDLIITDMTMPRMTGDELSTELIHIRPDIPIIVCTGYSEKLTEEKAMSIGIRAYMGKPLLKSEMAETIRRVLDRQNEVA